MLYEGWWQVCPDRDRLLFAAVKCTFCFPPHVFPGCVMCCILLQVEQMYRLL